MEPTAEGRVDPSKIRKRGYLSWFLLVTALVTVAAGCSSPVHRSAPNPGRALDRFVTQEAAMFAGAARQSGKAGPFESVHSRPVPDKATLVAVAAFSYGPGRDPVQVLAYATGRWSVTGWLPYPDWPPVQADLPLLPGAPVSVADVTGDGQPDFLITLEGGENTPGMVVSQDGGSWRYVPFVGPYPSSNVVGRSPEFRGHLLVSRYNDCTPSCAAGHEYTLTWTYLRATGDFWSPNPPGYGGLTGPTAVNHQDPQHFIGHWYVHDATMHITSLDTGERSGLSGDCGPNHNDPCYERDELSLLVSEPGPILTATIVRIAYLDRSTDREVWGPPPDEISAVGDSFRVWFVADDLLDSAIIRSHLPQLDQENGNPYWCQDGLAPELQYLCGA